MGKTLRLPSNPLTVKVNVKPFSAAVTRSDKNPTLVEHGRSELCKKTCLNAAAHIWNIAPDNIKSSKSIYSTIIIVLVSSRGGLGGTATTMFKHSCLFLPPVDRISS